MQKIDLLVGDNPYGTTLYFAKSLSKAWNLSGIQSRLFWVADNHFFHALQEIKNDPPDLTCSFSDIHIQGHPIADFLQIPHLSILVDPAIYFLHQTKSNMSWISCVDQDDVDWLSKSHQQVFFLPHGVDETYKTSPEKKRDYDAVFFGTCLDYKKIEQSWKRTFPKAIADKLKQAADFVLSPGGDSILKALLKVGIEEKMLIRMHHEVDAYVRGKDRIELIKSVIKEERITIWGSGPWKELVPKATVHPPLPFDKTLEIMKNAQLVLNSSPRFKAGSHERILYGLMCGAAVLTGETAFTKNFAPHELLIYPFGQWEKRQYGCLQEVAWHGQQRVYQIHTWKVRSQQIIQFMN